MKDIFIEMLYAAGEAQKELYILQQNILNVFLPVPPPTKKPSLSKPSLKSLLSKSVSNLLLNPSSFILDISSKPGPGGKGKYKL